MGSRWCLYGYEVRNNKYFINTEEAKIVKTVFEQYLSGLTLKTIADELSSNKVQYYKDRNTWNKNMVSRIIENQHYLGDETYPKIIEEDIFRQAVGKKKSKGGIREKDSKEMKFLKNHTYCSECGEKYIRKFITRCKHEKWYCSNSCKTQKYIDDEVIFKGVMELINMAINVPELLEHTEKEEKSYEPNLNVIKKENELSYMIEQNTKTFQDYAKEVLSLATDKFDCCLEIIDEEYTCSFYEYMKSMKCLDKLEYSVLFDIVDRITIDEKGNISIKFVNNTALYSMKGEYKNVAC